MSLEHIVLGMLNPPKSGYDLRAEFAAGMKYIWSAELSQIYPLLKRMEQSGLIRSESVKSDKGPPRLVYSRTAKGMKALEQWLLQEPILGTERFAYLAQMILMHELDDLDASKKFMTSLRDRLASYAEFLRQAEQSLIQQAGQPSEMESKHLHNWMSLQVGIKSLQAKVEACDLALSVLQKHKRKA